MATKDDEIKAEAAALQARIKAERALEKQINAFNKAMASATNGAIDDFTVEVGKLLKTTKALSEEQKRGIKNAKDVAAAYQTQQQNAKLAEEAMKRYAQARAEDNRKRDKSYTETAKVVESVRKEFESLNITLGVDFKKDLREMSAQAELTANTFIKASATLGSKSVQVSKELENMRATVISNTASFFTLAKAMGFAKKAIVQTYEVTDSLAVKGMLGATAKIIWAAGKLNMVATDLSELAGKSRSVINMMGGGAKGMDNFLEAIAEGQAALEIFGRDGAKYAAGFLDAVTKSGIAKGDASFVRKTALDLANQFKYMSAVFDDTAEGFTNYYEQLLKSESIQSRINALDRQGVQLMMQEQITRTRLLRDMGLQSEQIIAMNKRYEEMFNPKANKQGEELKNRGLARISYKLRADEMARAGNIELANQMQEDIGLYDDFVNSSVQGKAQKSTDSRYQRMLKNIAIAEDKHSVLKDEGTMGGLKGNASIQGLGSVAAGSMGGNVINDPLAAAGRAFLLGKNTGQDVTPEQAKARLEFAGYKEVKDAQGNLVIETNKLGKAFAELKNVVQAAEVWMKNPLTTGISAFVAGLGTAILMVLSRGRAGMGMAGMGRAGMGMAGIKLPGGTAAQAFESKLAGLGNKFGGTAAQASGSKLAGLGNKVMGVARGAGRLLGPVAGAATYLEAYNATTPEGIKENIEHGKERIAELNQLAILDPQNAAKYNKEAAAIKQQITAMQAKLGTATIQPASADYSNEGKVSVPAMSPVASTVPKSSAFASMIAKAESGSAGYNANNKGTSNGKIIAGDKEDLQSMTIAQIMQRQALPNGDPKRLFAVGKYQMIPDTLKEAVNYLKIPTSTKFTPDVQEQLFGYLINKKRPEIGNYLSGKSNDLNSAMLGASKEWASVANPATGASYYGSGNKASISTNEVANALIASRTTGVNTPTYEGVSNTAGITVSGATATNSAAATKNPLLEEAQKQTNLMSQTNSALNKLASALAKPKPSGDSYQPDMQTAAVVGP